MIGVYIDNKMYVAYEASKDDDINTVINLIDKQISWVYKMDKIGIDNNNKPIKKRHYYANIPMVYDSEASGFYIDSEGKQVSNNELHIILDNLYTNVYNSVLKKTGKKKKAKNKATIAVVRKRAEYLHCATMYSWQMSFDKVVIVGRTWQEWFDFLATLKEYFKLDKYKSFIFYIHNLKYDANFFKNYIKWDNDNTLITDKVYYYMTTDKLYYDDKQELDFSGFIFKDSLALSSVRLERLPEIMKHATISKQVGKIDHSKIRHSKTPLTTDEEYSYIVADVLLLSEYIKEKIEQYHYNITDIPMTATGEIRRVFRDNLFYTDSHRKSKKDDKYKSYIAFLDNMKIDAAIYQQIKRAFQGGYNGCNRIHVGKIFIDCIYSIDIKSAYPAVMLCEKFAMSPYEKIQLTSKKEFNYYIENKACLFDVTLYDIRPKQIDGIDFDYIAYIIKTSKLEQIGRDYPFCKPLYPGDGEIFEEDKWYKCNGRLRCAERITMTVNEIDWRAICKFYDFDTDRVHVANFRIAEKKYLPKPIIEYVLNLYNDKEAYATYKDSGKPEELFYRLNKRALNSLFGMIATDIIRQQYYFNDENIITRKYLDLDTEEKIAYQQKEIEEKANFLCYQWSHTLTSYCRLYIFDAISKLGYTDGNYNYVYSDTDSVKIIVNNEKELYKLLNYIKDFNAEMDNKKIEVLKYYHFITEMEGYGLIGYENYDFISLLGHFILENNGKPYKKFCTVGNKRYLVESEKGLEITVSGLDKKSISYLKDKYKDDLFNVFSKNEIEVDREHSGRTVATFINDKMEGEIVDYLGNKSYFCEESSVHIESAPYRMKECEDYEHLLVSNEIEGWRGL